MPKKHIKLRNSIIIFLALVAEAIFVLWPLNVVLNYEQFHSAITSASVVFGLVFGLVGGLGFGLVAGLVAGLVVGLGFGLVGGLGFGLVVGLVVGLVAGLVAGLAAGLDVGLGFGLVAGLVGGLGFGLVAGLVGGLGFGLGVGLGVGLGIFIGIPLGILTIHGLKRVFKDASDTIKAVFTPWRVDKFSIWGAIIFFVIMYVGVILIFSVWFLAFYDQGNREQNPSYFINDKIGEPTWWDFCYFSFVTIATIGYGDISPVRSWPQFFVFLEHISGVSLIAVYLALVLQAPGRRRIQRQELTERECREITKRFLLAFPDRDDSQIAEIVGCDVNLVSSIREDMKGEEKNG